MILPVSAEDTRNLQASAEGLVEQHSSLKLRNEREPSQERNRSEQKQSHDYLVETSKRSNRAPKSQFYY